MLTDPIADMFARLRNAALASHDIVVFPASKIKEQIAILLKKEGYILDVSRVQKSPQDELRVTLRRTDGVVAFKDFKRVSSPGRRTYVKADEIPRVMNGYGVAIISTSQGLMTDREARKAGLGGEVLSTVW